jgi:tetratricopeptide (TPR) repeat protein
LERLGHNALLLGNKEDAARYYSEILNYDATNVMVYETLMDIYIQTNKYKYYVSRGNLHSVEHQLEHAINDFKKALTHTQEDSEIMNIHFILASLYEQTKNNIKAIDEYLKILDYDDAGEVAYVNLARLYAKDNAEPSAIEILERAIKKGFDSDAIKEDLAQLYIKEGDNEKALAITPVEFTKVKCLLGMEKFEEAKTKLDNLEKSNANNATFLSLMAEYYFSNNDFDNALNYVDKFDKVQQNSPLTYQMRALIFENKNDDYNAHINWAKYNILRGDKDIAINEYLNAYQYKDDDVNMISSLASLLEDSGDKNHAMEMYERLIQLDDTDKKSLEKLAEFRESIGDYQAQADYLEKLLEVDKRNYSLILKLAKLNEKLKNKADAANYYKKYLAIAPVNDEYNNVKAKLEAVENVPMEEDEGFIGVLMKMFKK